LLDPEYQRTVLNIDVQIRVKRSLLDVVAEVLVADPGASLAEVAEAAGISRTTLYNHYATRDDLLSAVGNRVLDLWEEAVGKAEDGPDGGLAALTSVLLPLCPQLMFLWRNAGLEKHPSLVGRWDAGDEGVIEVLKRAEERGVLTPGLSETWRFGAYISLLIAASGEVSAGRLAPQDAPGRVLDLFLHGIGTSPGPDGGRHE
jgi:AcrR family transcriptional regulator